jgi:hypothetical protein
MNCQVDSQVLGNGTRNGFRVPENESRAGFGFPGTELETDTRISDPSPREILIFISKTFYFIGVRNNNVEK